MTLSKEEKEKDLDVLYKRREFLDQKRMELANYFDKYLLSFSTGALYLSVISLNLDGRLQNICLLIIGWIALIVTIIITIFSFIIGEKAHEKQIEIVDAKIYALINEKNRKTGVINSYNGTLGVIQILGAVTFLIGIISLMIVYFVNI